ncbi:MAG TPA: hypothetical protein VMT89_07965 [Candidatus Acidoferrales bacterium]|nr:hypothetical protein [Candidatus Acidoferrales bacterium]
MTWLRSRRLRVALFSLAAIGTAAWWYHSQLIGIAARWYLLRVAAAEQSSGDATERRKIILQLHRALLLQPPPDGLVPELYDFVTELSQRVASGTMSWNWGAYLYTSYERDAEMQRPNGDPRRSRAEIVARLDHDVAFFSIRGRGVALSDLLSGGYTVDEIEAAHNEGRDLGRATAADR